MPFTYRQKILKTFYPVFTFLKKLKGQRKVLSGNGVFPPVSFYSLPVILNSGSIFDTTTLKGKKILIVNTASNCGFTNQYAELQQLYSDPAIKIEIIGFPSNDFKEQEKASDEEIATFCSVNFGVSFPLAKKSSVLKSPAQNPIFQWLSNKNLNGWNDQQPVWNFSKYLINEEGILCGYFDPAISPLSEVFLKYII